MGIISSISPVQWIFIAVGALLVVPGLWPVLKRLISNVEVPDIIPNGPPHGPHDDHEDCLRELVDKWEDLADCCHDCGVHDACNKLEEVFPMLIKVKEDEHRDRYASPVRSRRRNQR